MTMTIEWCNDQREVERLAAFFASNVSPAYISHSELQYGRAKAPGEWLPDLEATLRDELSERIPMLPDKRVAHIRREGELVGIALVAFNLKVPIPFVIVEDITISTYVRNEGIGQQFLSWILTQARALGIQRAYLESGKDNHEAHHFFERNNFKQVSVVMMAELN